MTRGAKLGSHWAGQKIQCSCGAIIHESALKPTGLHMRSIVHNRNKTIHKLLEENNITQMEIAARVGLTRERIRQIARDIFGKIGRQQQGIRKVKKMQAKYEQYKAEILELPLISELHEKCQKLGYSFVPIGTARQHSGALVEINGFLCVVKRAYPTRINSRWYWRLVRTTVEHDFIIYKIGEEWMVMPKARSAKMSQSSTVVIHSENPKMGTKSTAHDWPEWIDRFDLLK